MVRNLVDISDLMGTAIIKSRLPDNMENTITAYCFCRGIASSGATNPIYKTQSSPL